MNHDEIKAFIEAYTPKRQRTLVIVDFANVSKWNEGNVALGWDVGVPQLAKLIKNFAYGKQELRRFYYGEDFGPKSWSTKLTKWSELMLQHAQYANFHIESKRVKYIVDNTQPSGYRKKCDLDVEMTVDLIRLQDEYDQVILFSGDGDLVCALRYLNEEFGKKEFYVFASRGHIGSEVIDAEKGGLITQIFYAEVFEYRLSRSFNRSGNQPRFRTFRW